MGAVLKVSVALLTLFATLVAWSALPARADSLAMEDLVNGNSQFALDVYAQLRERTGNLFLSPYSISTALGMTYAGARGHTARQMSEVLHFTLETKRVHSAFGHLETQLNTIREKGNIKLSIANALWAHKYHNFLDEFLEIVKTNYRAELRHADFETAHEAAREEINAWVEDQTHEKIKELIKRGILNSLTRLVLVNAIYFKGLWASQFEKSATQEASFWVAPDTRVGVPMMNQEGEFKYMEDADTQVLELPYAGNDLSMVIMLPKKVDGLGQLEASLSLENVNAWFARLRKRRVTVSLPRLKMDSQFSLEKTLESMGMPDAFKPGIADFSGMDGTRMLYISAVVHRAFVNVNEEGTEAAAATGVVVGVTSAPGAPTVFRADHPFFFLILDNASGTVLFLGRLVDPKK